MAVLIMTGRQGGMSYVEAVDKAKEATRGNSSDTLYGLALNIIDSAYAIPVEKTERGARAAAITFGEDIFSSCHQGVAQ